MNKNGTNRGRMILKNRLRSIANVMENTLGIESHR
jgi:hypothetical protein